MKKFNRYLTALLLSFFVTGGAQAIPLSDLLVQGASITAGDKLFADWRIIDQTIIGGNVIVPDYSLIDVTALNDGGTDPGPGLLFTTNGQLRATGDVDGYSFIDLFFGFSVTVLDPTLLIKDVSLNLTGGFVTNSGDNGFYILEQVGTTPAFVEQDPSIADLATTEAEFSYLNGLTSNLSGSATFAPQSKIYVSKNILVWSSDINETASLDTFTQRFSQQPRNVPEPNMVLLMAVGLMGFAFSVKGRKILHVE